MHQTPGGVSQALISLSAVHYAEVGIRSFHHASVNLDGDHQAPPILLGVHQTIVGFGIIHQVQVTLFVFSRHRLVSGLSTTQYLVFFVFH